jgi:hypothetical protein
VAYWCVCENVYIFLSYIYIYIYIYTHTHDKITENDCVSVIKVDHIFTGV